MIMIYLCLGLMIALVIYLFMIYVKLKYLLTNFFPLFLYLSTSMKTFLKVKISK